MQDILLVLSNLPDRACAEKLAQHLVAERLAACVNILPACHSVYRWQGQMEHAEEVPILIKTTSARYDALEAAIRAQHPYETPEILAFTPERGLEAYLGWVRQETL